MGHPSFENELESTSISDNEILALIQQNYEELKQEIPQQRWDEIEKESREEPMDMIDNELKGKEIA